MTDTAIARAAQLAPAVGDSRALRQVIEHLGARIAIEPHALRIELDRGLLADAMKVGSVDGLIRDPIVLAAPVSLKRRGIELRLVYAAHDIRPANRDPHLIDLIRRAWAAWKKLATEPRSANPVERSHLVRLARLRFLAPDITLAIIEGRQPVELTARTLLRCGELPVDWVDQRKALGFA